MKSKPFLMMVSIVMIMSFLAACATATPTIAPTEAPSEPPVAETTAPPAETSAPTEAPTAAPTSAPAMDVNALPPDPRIVTITTDDNFTLSGYYYPAAYDNAPVVVLMHWMMGDKADWNEVAVWLQNRGMKNPFENPGDPAKFRWWDPTWFPAVPADQSYAVLTFSFRDCQPFQQGCQAIHKAGWVQDALAALKFARELEGVDATRVAAIGSSIGADGAADSCQLLNKEFPGTCKGAFSLSPGDYLDVSYVNTIQQLGRSDPPTAAWCVADPGEFAICQSAEGAGNTAYQDFSITDGDHGNMLLSPDLDPLPMQLILDFLDETMK